jgi:hypothetical protein
MYNKQETLAADLKDIDKLFLGLKQAKRRQSEFTSSFVYPKY